MEDFAINFVGLLLILVGIIVKHTRSYNLIAGYNMMPPEEQKKVDIASFATLLRNCFIVMGLSIIIGFYFFKWIGWNDIAEAMVPISLATVLPYLIIVGGKYDTNQKPEKLKRNKKILFGLYILTAIISSILLIKWFIESS